MAGRGLSTMEMDGSHFEPCLMVNSWNAGAPWEYGSYSTPPHTPEDYDEGSPSMIKWRILCLLNSINEANQASGMNELWHFSPQHTHTYIHTQTYAHTQNDTQLIYPYDREVPLLVWFAIVGHYQDADDDLNPHTTARVLKSCRMMFWQNTFT